MVRRAEQVDQTRQRIVEASVALHGSIGFAASTVAAIADKAGVTRLTVYKHFPDQTALFTACSAHWLSQQQRPDTAAWTRIGDPDRRLRAGLADLYRYYRAGAGMLTHVYRDFAAMPEELQRRWREDDDRRCDLLAAPFGGNPGQRRLIRAVTGHAASFWTWHSLCVGQGLADQEAVDVMTNAVLAATLTPPGEPEASPDRNTTPRSE